MFSYDPTLALDRDWVRFQIADKVAPGTLQDEEINALLRDRGNKYLAAADAGEAILARTKGVVSKQVGDLGIRWGESDTGSQYRAHIARLRERGIQLKTSVLRIL